MNYKIDKKFPKTRYQGSKLKLVNWIEESLSDLEYTNVLDAFSGTSTVGYMFKKLNKKVYSNDFLKFNFDISTALIENNNTIINDIDIDNILNKKDNFEYLNTIEYNFKDIYFLEEENKWLDIVIQNIHSLKDKYKKSMFLWALYQSCISKRPYNLFHRKNLYIRTKEIKRSFGNKTTWDKSFELHFRKFIKEINSFIINNNKENKSFNDNIFDLNINEKIDLVYFDPPYIPKKGSLTKYKDFYHFLEGVSDYYNWIEKIDKNSLNYKFNKEYNIWEDKKNIIYGFEKIINKFKDSIIVISYREDGIPDIDSIVNILKKHNKNVIIKKVDYNYVFSKNKNSKEILIIAN